MSSRLYKFLIAAVDKRVPQIARPFWEYEAGPKTIFFVKKIINFQICQLHFMCGCWMSDDYVAFDRENAYVHEWVGGMWALICWILKHLCQLVCN